MPYIPRLKSLDQEIEDAFKNQIDLDEFILREEAKDVVPNNKVRLKVTIPDWDQDF